MHLKLPDDNKQCYIYTNNITMFSQYELSTLYVLYHMVQIFDGGEN